MEVAIGRITGFQTPTQKTAVPIGRSVEGSGSKQKKKSSRSFTVHEIVRPLPLPPIPEGSRELNCCLVIEHRVDPAIASRFPTRNNFTKIRISIMHPGNYDSEMMANNREIKKFEPVPFPFIDISKFDRARIYFGHPVGTRRTQDCQKNLQRSTRTTPPCTKYIITLSLTAAASKLCRIERILCRMRNLIGLISKRDYLQCLSLSLSFLPFLRI